MTDAAGARADRRHLLASQSCDARRETAIDRAINQRQRTRDARGATRLALEGLERHADFGAADRRAPVRRPTRTDGDNADDDDDDDDVDVVDVCRIVVGIDDVNVDAADGGVCRDARQECAHARSTW